MRGEKSLVELHAFDEFDRGVQGLALFDGDDAILADFGHGLGDHLADLLVLVGAGGADLGDFLVAVDFFRHFLKLGDDGFDGQVDAALNLRGIGAGADVFHSLGEDGFGVDGGGGGSVAGDAGGLGGDFLDHLRAHVFVGIFQLDFLGDGDAVLGDGGRAEGFFEHDVSARRSERDFDGSGELANPAKDGLAGFLIICDSFCGHVDSSKVSEIDNARPRGRG